MYEAHAVHTCISCGPHGVPVGPVGAGASPGAPRGSGTVIAVDAQGRATGQVGEKQQTVHLPDAKVGDQVDCKVVDGPWQCTVQPK